MHSKNWIRLSVLIILLAGCSGCSSVSYYWQAINGHLDIVERERPINELLQEKQLEAQLRRKLALVQSARKFASSELGLPDNESYTSYVDLKRQYVTWNVVATAEFSVKPRQWCYLFAGCFNYRGYFNKQAATNFAVNLKKAGDDVAVGGAWAYSTLGWFDDPVLSTMLQHDDTELIGTLFHELGHQTVYVDNDSSFNESFANTVERVGLQRWYRHIGRPEEYASYLKRQQSHDEIVAMLEKTRENLRKLYAGNWNAEQKKSRKQALFAELKQDYRRWRESHDYPGFDRFMQQPLNNANLAMIATYSDDIPAFLKMLADAHGDLPAFYRAARRVGKMNPVQRSAELARYKSGSKTANAFTNPAS